jgi:glycosyltransferase involved in cell wall biosynthesis
MKRDLTLVMPVYNEQDCIQGVVQSWLDVLSSLPINFALLILEGSSKDNTAAVLKTFDNDPRVEVVTLPKCGHGPTLMIGYRMAAANSDWVFQCDSDNEIPAEPFVRLWKQRDSVDAVFGVRSGRSQRLGRKLLSLCSRLTVRMLVGPGVRDVNGPYRLMRSSCLEQLIEQMPADAVAPNVIISGAFARSPGRILNVPVDHRGRKTGQVSVRGWKLFKWAFRAFWQTLRCRPALRKCRMTNVE